MKRITMLSFEVAADTETTAFAEESDSDTAESAAEETESSGKVLVVYYAATGSDLFTIEPVEPYTSDDLNWTNSDSRVSVEHDNPDQYFDLYSKGGKLRRIYIPKSLQKEALIWLTEKKQDSGFIFLNQRGQRITTRGISGELKKFAEKYGIDKKVVYPHSFRHRFAKSFLAKCNDIAFLADLMGHESIETTRIYLRKTATEQREIVDEVIDW